MVLFCWSCFEQEISLVAEPLCLCIPFIFPHAEDAGQLRSFKRWFCLSQHWYWCRSIVTWASAFEWEELVRSSTGVPSYPQECGNVDRRSRNPAQHQLGCLPLWIPLATKQSNTKALSTYDIKVSQVFQMLLALFTAADWWDSEIGQLDNKSVWSDCDSWSATECYPEGVLYSGKASLDSSGLPLPL